MSVLRQVLAQLREESKTQREKGDYFERLALHYLKHDPVMRQQYENPQLFSDWAKEQGKDGRDTGIDIVAKISDEEGYCAVQCKFRKERGKVSRNELAGFLAASGTADFSRRLVIDTTEGEWGTHAESVIDGQEKLVNRITIYNLEESDIDWEAWLHSGKVKMREGRKKPRKDQKEAIRAVCNGLEEADRGKLILPCGTGKTFTSLKIAEEMVGGGKAVLFLVPSLALMSQTIRAWAQDATVKQRCFAVCSDTKVDNRRKNDDSSEIKMHDLAYPATTDAVTLAAKAKGLPKDRMTVVFATYQSLQVISDAQKKHGLWEFDLIVCDEAHRTTGAKLPGESESNFVKVHYQEHIEGKKRLYMTATPRVFGDEAKSKASDAAIELCSMDDKARFGGTLFSRKFGWAVEEGLLTDYKVIVLGVDEGMISSSLQNALAESSELNLDDANKIIGCYRALAKQDQKEFGKDSNNPMRRALAFCRDIKRSKLVEAEFTRVVEEYLESAEGSDIKERAEEFQCEIEHVDGTFNAKKRSQLIDWLKEGDEGTGCRILTNAKCLAEGVDVPALDAILFMHPRKSQVDVVQSVGRVMRRAEGKKMGYIILPVGVPAGIEPNKALDDNKRYRLVWDTLNALRSHDERLESDINKAGLGVDVSNRIEIIAVSNQLPNARDKQEGATIGHGSEHDEDSAENKIPTSAETQGFLAFDEWSNAVIARLVRKCGRRDYWKDWAKNIAEIAQKHISRIKGLTSKPGKEREALTAFLTEIQEDLNDSVTEEETIEMLAQHLITHPVFEALFDDSSFVLRNPVSRAMQQVLEALSEHNIEKEAGDLQEFYASVRRRVAGIDDPKAKQKLVVELYDEFFRHAFPKMTDRLGIVYTPVEIVDFILRSVDNILQKEFAQTMGSKGVHVIDPFAGTGTFITRLLQLGLIKPEELEHKYTNELHANEIILLAYYIAAINIEATYRDVASRGHLPFEGICLTDTFQLYEKDVDLVSDMMVDNSNRRIRQKKLDDIRVIVGNPPYSVGQESVNHDAANLSYPKLDARIRETYAKRVSGNRNSLYDSYIRAIRWASDRIGKDGVIGYVTNAGWLENKAGGGYDRVWRKNFRQSMCSTCVGIKEHRGINRARKEGRYLGLGVALP